MFSRKKHWHTSSLTFHLHFVNPQHRERGTTPQPGYDRIFWGQHWWCCLRNFFKSALLALPLQAFPCLAQSQKTVNISSCDGVVNSIFCICFSSYYHGPHLLCSAFTPHLVLHLMPQSFIPAEVCLTTHFHTLLCCHFTKAVFGWLI